MDKKQGVIAPDLGAVGWTIGKDGMPTDPKHPFNADTRLREDYVNRTVNAAVAITDANDFLYYFDASRDYNPESRLNSITAPVLWVNSADDFINPRELEIAQKLVTRMPHARFVLIPASMQTFGHGTHTHGEVWKNYLIELLTDSAKK